MEKHHWFFGETHQFTESRSESFFDCNELSVLSIYILNYNDGSPMPRSTYAREDFNKFFNIKKICIDTYSHVAYLHIMRILWDTAWCKHSRCIIIVINTVRYKSVRFRWDRIYSLRLKNMFWIGVFVPRDVYRYTPHVTVYPSQNDLRNCRTRPYRMTYLYNRIVDLCAAESLGLQRNSMVTVNGTTATAPLGQQSFLHCTIVLYYP